MSKKLFFTKILPLAVDFCPLHLVVGYLIVDTKNLHGRLEISYRLRNVLKVNDCRYLGACRLYGGCFFEFQSYIP
jgi:hypothetical protein